MTQVKISVSLQGDPESICLLLGALAKQIDSGLAYKLGTKLEFDGSNKIEGIIRIEEIKAKNTLHS